MAGRAFTALYVFGDSLSDTGNNPAPNATNYYEGRYSNGPLWVEYLSALLGFAYNPSNNFAVSGSTTSNLLAQVAGLPASTNLRTGLFTVWSGGNDFLDDTSALTTNTAAWNVVISNAVQNITNAVATLYTNGGREFIVGNLPNLGRLPAFIGTPAGYTNYIDALVATFNSLLATDLTNLMQGCPGLRVYLQDNNTLLNAILAAPAAYGFTVITNGALEDSNLTNKSFTGPGANYVFWDVIHPTTKLHGLTAGGAFLNVAVEMNLSRSGTNLNLLVTNLYPGLPYTIQTSTNLPTWSNYHAFTAGTTNTNVAATNAGTKTYYRVIY